MTTLGIDLGTTSVKVALVSTENRSLIGSCAKTHNASISNLPSSHHEQDPLKILFALHHCMADLQTLNKSSLNAVRSIAVSGQMHGVVRWSGTKIKDYKESLESLEALEGNISSLITWMDKRATKEFLSSLPKPTSHLGIHSGFGCASLLHLSLSADFNASNFDSSGSVADFLVVMLCGLKKPVMSDQMAASWGYFDTETCSWNFQILEQANFPLKLLPDVLRAGEKAGNLDSQWFGIPLGVPVLAALGDFQAGIWPYIAEKTAIITIGTSAQICCQAKPDITIKKITPVEHQTMQYFPFFNGRCIVVGASLNGGNVINNFVETLNSWLAQLGIGTTNDLWKKIEDCLLEEISHQDSGKPPSTLKMTPTIFAERHAPTIFGSMVGITSENTKNLGETLFSIVLGIVANLSHIMPLQNLLDNSVTEILLMGEARKPWYKSAVEKIYADSGLKIIVTSDSDSNAAFGCALLASELLRT